MVEIWILMAMCMQIFFLALSDDPPGFINIDCGIGKNEHYIDQLTGLTYVSDDQYIDTGENHIVASDYITDDGTLIQYNTLRSFPNNTKNCYTITSVMKDSKYLVRASFYYGNYDNEQSSPTFDLYLGVIFWTTFDAQPDYYYYEIIAVAQSNYIQVCLVNKGLGDPFISMLELRPLSSTLYSNAHSKQFLNLLDRWNIGGDNSLIRYPEDEHDRLWYGWTDGSWTAIYTDSPITINSFDVPSSVLQTAAVTTDTNTSLDISYYYLQINNQSATIYAELYFAEIQNIASTDFRSFDVYSVGYYWDTVIPDYFSQSYFEIKQIGLLDDAFNLSLLSTPDSTLPPILNAYEIFEALPVTSLPTDDGDVSAFNSIKQNYKPSKDWNGDPCLPTSLRWIGVDCTNDYSVFSRITALDLSYSKLSGKIIDAFGNLSKLQNLNLSHNDLSGKIPISLDQLTALEFLDISSNFKLVGTLPPNLMKRLMNGHLQVNYNDTGIVIDGTRKKSSKVVLVAIVTAVVVLLIGGAIALLFFLWKKQKNIGINPDNPNVPNDRRRFSIEELKLITNNFSVQIGVGGFGKVFKGSLEKGEEVAVKVHSGLTSQGVNEFLNEVESLSRVHHRNLVRLIGYCDDRDNIALVYEYMQGGNLQNSLRGKAGPLDWKLRLQIVYESAKGLEYLHKMCDPPLIHRDIKANNILLTASREAKISDFGMVRALEDTHVATRVVGTPGYLDPFYAYSSQLTEKSDVYSFGVVLLEIITGRSPILEGSQMGEHLTQFVYKRLSRGNIESVLDPKIQGQYNLNSVWKVASLALRCTDEPARRPDMIAVVTELKEALDLENFSSTSTGTSNMASLEISLSTDTYHSRNANSVGGEIHDSSYNEMVARIQGHQVPDYGPLAR